MAKYVNYLKGLYILTVYLIRDDVHIKRKMEKHYPLNTS